MYYFIGIKGTGMAALAIMLHDLGYEVIGSDLEKHFFTEDDLIKNGISILPFNPENIKDNSTIIIGNAFLEDFPEVAAARNNKTCKCYRYHEFLGELIKNYKSIGIAGSHGKTTTTTMMKTLMEKFSKTGYLIGDGEGFLEKDSEYICVEADEFRRHFIALHLDYAIINNIEIDHVDYFKDENDYFNAYQEFVNQVRKLVIYNGEDNWCNKLSFNDLEHYSYGRNNKYDFYPINLIETNEGMSFDLFFRDSFKGHYDLHFVGTHLLLDVLGVLALGTYFNFDNKVMEDALLNYHGPKRRYVVEKYKDSILIDDYAHHPTEVRVTLEASRKRFPDKELIAIFKPHRASRVKYFVDDFADALKLADKVYLLEFTSIDDKQDGTDVDIKYLQERIPNSFVLPESEEGAKILAKHSGACFVFMSSKDIYNLANMLKNEL